MWHSDTQNKLLFLFLFLCSEFSTSIVLIFGFESWQLCICYYSVYCCKFLLKFFIFLLKIHFSFQFLKPCFCSCNRKERWRSRNCGVTVASWSRWNNGLPTSVALSTHLGFSKDFLIWNPVYGHLTIIPVSYEFTNTTYINQGSIQVKMHAHLPKNKKSLSKVLLYKNDPFMCFAYIKVLSSMEIFFILRFSLK